MEKLLTKLFSFQRFARNDQLAEIINDVDEKYDSMYALSDMDLSFAVGGQSEENSEMAIRQKIKEKLEDR